MPPLLDQRQGPTAPRLVLEERAHTPPPTPDPSQRAAIESALHHPATLILGAPGTGKTFTALEVALRALDNGTAPHDILVLAATRRGAATLRDQFAARAARTVGAPMVRTAASAAFAILRERAELRGEPAPTLISGPEQDLMLAELLAGHVAGDGTDLTLPPGLNPDVLGLRGLRQELRDLLMRAAERGLNPEELADLGRRFERPEWTMAARLYDEYLAVTALGVATPDVGARYDAAVVVDEAAHALATWERDVQARTPHWQLVVVDDYHEATVATARLLGTLRDAGARIVLAADPDAAVQGFRGATPALVGRAGAPAGGPDGGFDAMTCVLDTAWRQGPILRTVTERIASQIGTVGGVGHRAAVPGQDADGVDVEVAILPGVAQEAAFVARELRSAHLMDQVPWDAMAVIARSGGQLAALRRALIAASVPVTVLGSDVPLRDEPAVAPLLAAVRAAAREAIEPDVASALLVSPLGGLDAVGLRRLRRALREEELAGGGSRTSDELLIDLFESPARAATLPPNVQRAATAVLTVLDAARKARDEGPQGVLWALWEASGLSARWQALALAGGPGGARADRDLDAILALFRAAETFAERMPGASALAFVDYVSAQDLPADSLASRAAGLASVVALTPAGAAGGEWDVVVVAGVQDGVWPDLRLRDSLLGSQSLVDVLAGRSAQGHAVGPEARRAVLDDELRSFLVATSRARRRLVVTAVENTEDVPSPLCSLVVPPEPGAGDGRRVRPRAAPPLDLRGAVAQARSILLRDLAASTDGSVGRPARRSAQLLAGLAGLGITEADPDTWYGVHDVSGDTPLRGAHEIVEVSPSKVESVGECALRWALESAGGSAPGALSQSLGTLVHSIAQNHPQGTRAELRAELDRRWPELRLVDGWPQIQLRRRAEAMIDRLADYLAGTQPALVEAAFALPIGRALLRGVVDRVETAGPGVVRVADLKTGRQIATKSAAQTNPQLGAYQLAVEGGALDVPVGTRSAGGTLVYLAQGADGPTLREQGALNPDADGSSWAQQAVAAAAEQMAGAEFVARANALCPMCPVRRSCPVRVEGRQVIE